MRILIIEDDPATIETISLIFEVGWPDVDLLSSTSGITAMELLEKESPDLIILDLGLPDIDGTEVLREIRQNCDIPVLIVSGRNQPVSIVKGLGLGAEDYITKPFNAMEFLARVKNILRRSQTTVGTDTTKPLVYGNLVINFAAHKVNLAGKPVKLTAKEWNLLNYLALNEDKVIPHRLLWKKVWGNDYYCDTLAIRTCVWRLRSK
ncbi:MAG: response regulator transcription factor, partial [Dehalococcoidia bacterium]